MSSSVSYSSYLLLFFPFKNVLTNFCLLGDRLFLFIQFEIAENRCTINKHSRTQFSLQIKLIHTQTQHQMGSCCGKAERKSKIKPSTSFWDKTNKESGDQQRRYASSTEDINFFYSFKRTLGKSKVKTFFLIFNRILWKWLPLAFNSRSS